MYANLFAPRGRPAERVGVVSDIHAQPGGLERALTLLVERGVDRIVCLGDVVEKGPDPQATVDLLRAWTVPCVTGNHDQNAVRHAALSPHLRGPDEPPITPDALAWLEGLPTRREYLWSLVEVVLAHGAPSRVDCYVFPGEFPKRLRRSFRRGGPDVILLGHTHRPMRTRYRHTRLFNPGSVARGRRRDSYTCGLLTLPTMDFEVIDLKTGRAVGVEEIVLKVP